MGLFTGYCLADIRSETTKVGRYAWYNKAETLLCFAFLLAIVFFPLPNYVPRRHDMILPYPSWVGIAYSGLFRPLWGLGLCRLIWNLEKYRSGWVYNFLSCQFWEIFAKLNFSVYLIHYILLSWLTQLFMHEQFHFSGMLAIVLGLGEVTLIYMIGLVFYVMVEYPISLGSRKIMRKLRG